MAHPNIDARRACVEEMMQVGCSFSPMERKHLANLFDCSESAIYQDVLFFRRPPFLRVFPNAKTKARVRARDGKVCQYCGRGDAATYVIEHVIPIARHGVGADYNLVVACGSCNTRKGSEVWLPLNLDIITANNLEWRTRILDEAKKDTRRKTGPKNRLDKPIKYSTQLTEAHREMLEDYCIKHDLSAAQAIRKGIELLVAQDK